MTTRPPNLRRNLVTCALAGCMSGAIAACAAEANGPLEPRDALAQFQIDPGLTIELVACEPEVIDPIAIRFDEDGRLWVVEMRDYPHGPKPGEPPMSKIRVLEDRDGDGRYETSRVFADQLLFPTGLQPWKGGVIVTRAGQVAYLKDTDGDGRADHTEVWYRGFTAENPQLRANHPKFGFDLRVTIANGLRGGVVADARHPDRKPVPIGGMDFCFEPVSGDCEAVSGNGQFGSTFDDFGNRFVCNNRAPLDHVVLENRYLARNPFLVVPTVLASVAAGGEASHVYPLTAAWTTSNLHAGQFTAACGIEIYRGDALGAAYRGNAFTCEPTGSLVHRERLTADGVTFVGHPAEDGKEFLASRDPWFRPVNLEVGPDGALYVVDMYRAVIEHPQYMPSELQERPDLRLGDDRGRIYRIVPVGKRSRPARPKLSAATTAQLVELLRHTNAWWRETAARLLFERRDPSADQPLASLAAYASEPTARVHALWVLSATGALSPEAIQFSLQDKHPRVRETAVCLAESRLRENAQLRQQVVALAADADDRVRFRAALALGALAAQDAVPPLLDVALRRPDDVWSRRAVLSAIPENVAALLAAALASPRVAAAAFDAPEIVLVRELATIVGARRDPAEIVLALQTIGRDNPVAAHEGALLGLAQGFERRGGSLADFVNGLSDEQAPWKPRLDVLFDRAAEAALDGTMAEDARAGKIDLLKFARRPRAVAALSNIMMQSPSQPLRIRAAAALAGHGDEAIGNSLLEAFSTQTPAVRRAVLDALIAQPKAAGLLLERIASGGIARGEIDAPRENRLRQHPHPAVKARAQEVLVPAVPADRKRVLAEYQPALALAADPRLGKDLFRQHCSTCHKIGDVGVDVAPDISDSRVKTAPQLLTDILNPNQAIDNNYVSYTVVTLDGMVHTGIVASETAGSITLRQPENKTVSVLRADVESIRSSGVSLMPDGFEKSLSQQQMADLIAFIKNWRYLEQPIPGTIGPRAN